MTPLITLTYDGMTKVQRHEILPLLRRFGLRATFFIKPETLLEDLFEHLSVWRRARDDGFELGNGGLLDEQLNDWSYRAILEEIRDTDASLSEVFPGTAATPIGWPPGEAHCRDGSVDHLTRMLNRPARSCHTGFNDRLPDARYWARYIDTHSLTAKSLFKSVEIATTHDYWVVFQFEGIGEGPYDMELDQHLEFLLALSKMRENVVPLGEVIAE